MKYLADKVKQIWLKKPDKLSGFDKHGALYMDPTPVEVEVPVMDGEQSIRVMLERMLRNERLKQLQDEAGEETYDDANDFETGVDDPLDIMAMDPASDYSDAPSSLEEAYQAQRDLEAWISAETARQASQRPPEPLPQAEPVAPAPQLAGPKADS